MIGFLRDVPESMRYAEPGTPKEWSFSLPGDEH